MSDLHDSASSSKPNPASRLDCRCVGRVKGEHLTTCPNARPAPVVEPEPRCALCEGVAGAIEHSHQCPMRVEPVGPTVQRPTDVDCQLHHPLYVDWCGDCRSAAYQRTTEADGYCVICSGEQALPGSQTCRDCQCCYAERLAERARIVALIEAYRDDEDADRAHPWVVTRTCERLLAAINGGPSDD